MFPATKQTVPLKYVAIGRDYYTNLTFVNQRTQPAMQEFVEHSVLRSIHIWPSSRLKWISLFNIYYKNVISIWVQSYMIASYKVPPFLCFYIDDPDQDRHPNVEWTASIDKPQTKYLVCLLSMDYLRLLTSDLNPLVHDTHTPSLKVHK